MCLAELSMEKVLLPRGLMIAEFIPASLRENQILSVL